MPVQLNHTIVHAHDAAASARFMTELFGLPAPVWFPPFQMVETANGVSLDFMDVGDAEIHPQHYAFIVTEDEFDQIFARIVERDIPYFADPHGHETQQINHHDGGRGTYFPDPSGHWLEIITRPYGSGG
jgi:catechol 2,3-dioxygenase-like lactoylglutathione lyase family enzyme